MQEIPLGEILSISSLIDTHWEVSKKQEQAKKLDHILEIKTAQATYFIREFWL